jgi:non-ribosomal peptide synthase protein (TIGR01720 family)
VPYRSSRSPEELSELVSEHGVTVLNQTPSAFSQFMAAHARSNRPHNLRYVILGGEALNVSVLKKWYEHNPLSRPQVINGYGITETTVFVTFHALDRADAERAGGSCPIGVRIPDLPVYILDPYRRPVPIGVAGELYVGGAGVARGYLNRPELTAERFLRDPFSAEPQARMYRSGDLARWRADGVIEYLGRNDEQVKIRGFRIELAEIEAQLGRHEQIREAVVIAREDGRGDKSLVAYFTVKAETAPPSEELRSYLKEGLPEYMVPTAFVRLRSMPLTPNGKADRRSLPAPDDSALSSKEYEAPQGKIETTLARIWSELLNVRRVGRHDDFFDIGGYSLKAIQVVNRASQASIQVTVHHIFKHPTVAALAEVATVFDAPVNAEQSGELPPTPILLSALRGENPEGFLRNSSGATFLCRRKLRAERLDQAFRHLIASHDALRLRVTQTEQGWRQCAVALDELPPGPIVEARDLSGVPREQLDVVLKECRRELMAQIDLRRALLVRGALCDLGPGQDQRLVLAIHHAATDPVSSGILFEDLWTTYACLESGQELLPLRRSATYMDWARELHGFATSAAAQDEVEYWREVLSRTAKGPRRTVRPPTGDDAPVRAGVSLSESETRELLTYATRRFRAEVNELLLTAVSVAYSRLQGLGPLLVELMRHGRASGIGSIDVSRTLGWFSADVPVILDNTAAEDLDDAVELTKQQLRAIPYDGVGYGVARQLVPGDPLQGLPEPEFGLNYEGDVQLDAEAGHLVLLDTAQLERGLVQVRRPGMLYVSASVAFDRLLLFWTHDPQLHSAEEVRALAEATATVLRRIGKLATEPERASAPSLVAEG